MYNRYIPNGTSYTRIVEEDAPSPHPTSNQHQGNGGQSPHQPNHAPQPSHIPQMPQIPFGGALEGVSGFLSGLLKRFDLGGLDTGDILLLLIILFIFMEGDDIEMVIVMGLMLLFGLGDKKDQSPKD